MSKALLFQLWLVYASQASPVGVYESADECATARAAVGADIRAQGLKPAALVCAPTRLVTHITVRELGLLP